MVKKVETAPKYVSVAVAARLTGLSARVIRRLVAEGLIPKHALSPRLLEVELEAVMRLVVPRGYVARSIAAELVDMSIAALDKLLNLHPEILTVVVRDVGYVHMRLLLTYLATRSQELRKK